MVFKLLGNKSFSYVGKSLKLHYLNEAVALNGTNCPGKQFADTKVSFSKTCPGIQAD